MLSHIQLLLNKEQIKEKSDKWFEYRHNILTASEVASVLEANPFATKYELLKRKCKPLKKSKSTNATTWGIKYEPIAIEIYKKFKNVQVYESGLFKHDNINWLGATPDGITSTGKLLEIKSVYNRKITEHEPYYYWIQVQIQLEVTNTEECDLFQCKFIEYDSKKDYYNDKITSKNLKGILKYNGKNFYWKLHEFNCKNIKRDKIWFESKLPILTQFIKDIEYYKINGLPRKKRSRSSSEIDEPVSKRTRSTYNKEYINKDWKKWVSATETKNYILDDPIIDWFNLYGGRYNIISDRNLYNKFNFNEFIKNKGIEFESAVILNLEKRFSSSIRKIANIYQGFSTEKATKTKLEMQRGTPIIVNGVLHNENDNTYGIPDLIIRSDYLNKIVQSEVLTKNEYSHGSNFSKEWFYVIIDIKFTTLTFRKNNNTIRNIGNISAYKSQIVVYNNALANIQGYSSPFGFILGRRIKIENEKFDSFYTMGLIDFIEVDKAIVEKTVNAIKWIKKLKKDGHKWDVYNPTIPELYPNMTNKGDYPWKNAKLDIANKINEITLIWNCGKKERDLAHNSGIFKWTDEKFKADILNFKNNKKIILNSLIKINKQKKNNSKKLYHKKIKNIINTENELELYVDFETANDLHDSFDSVINYTNESNLKLVNNYDNIIYLIGVGYINKKNKWIYQHFMVNRLSHEDEKKIINNWIEYINNICNNLNYTKYKMYHWSNAEPTLLNKALNRHNMEVNLEWFDLLKYFKDTPITVKGATNFGLKTIAKAMYKNKMIKTKWVDCSLDGLSAMLVAWYAEKECKIGRIKNIGSYNKMNDIIDYNEIDCKVIWDILRFLKREYI